MPNANATTQDRRQLTFTDLEQVLSDVRELHVNGYEQLGNWNLGQCCNHLAIAMDMSIDGFPVTLPPPISTVNHWMFFNVSWTPSLIGKFKFPTFPKAAQKDPIDDEEGVTRLVAGVERISQSDAVFRRNPFLGRMTRNQWLTFHAFHAQRHLGFLVPSQRDGTTYDETSDASRSNQPTSAT